jgi:phosphoglycolate phosphatase-like HAD superfamily hydrolase
VDTNHLQAETRAEDPSAPSAAATREAGQPDATQVVLVSGRVATVTSTSPSTPRSLAHEEWVAAMDARHRRHEAAMEVLRAAERDLEQQAYEVVGARGRGRARAVDGLAKALERLQAARIAVVKLGAEPRPEHPGHAQPEAAPR